MMIVLFVCSSCNSKNKFTRVDPFLRLYKYNPSLVKKVIQKKQSSLVLSISAKNMPLSSLCRILSDKTTYGIVFNKSLSNASITGEFKNSDIGEVLNVVSRQLNVECLKVGSTFFLGSIKQEDRGVLVKKVRGFDSEDLSKTIQAMLSDIGRCQVLSNGVVIVSDKEHVISKVSDMLTYIEAGFSGSFILQTYFVSIRKGKLLEAGLEVKSSGALSYDLSNNLLSFDTAKLDGFLNMLSKSNYADVYASPMFLLRDGVTGSWSDGKNIPIPKKSVSNYGVVTTNGYTFIETGLNVNAVVRESLNGVLLKIKVSLSDIEGFVESAPITSICSFNSECELKQNKIYLVGEMSRFKVLNTQKSSLLFGKDKGKSVIQVWVCVYRIGDMLNSKVIKSLKK